MWNISGLGQAFVSSFQSSWVCLQGCNQLHHLLCRSALISSPVPGTRSCLWEVRGRHGARRYISWSPLWSAKNLWGAEDLALHSTSGFVDLAKWLNSSEFWFLHRWNEDNNTPRMGRFFILTVSVVKQRLALLIRWMFREWWFPHALYSVLGHESLTFG